jgi:hypothetical protein
MKQKHLLVSLLILSTPLFSSASNKVELPFGNIVSPEKTILKGFKIGIGGSDMSHKTQGYGQTVKSDISGGTKLSFAYVNIPILETGYLIEATILNSSPEI